MLFQGKPSRTGEKELRRHKCWLMHPATASDTNSHSHDLDTDTAESEAIPKRATPTMSAIVRPLLRISRAQKPSSETTSTPQASHHSHQSYPESAVPGAQISEVTGALLLHSMSMKHGLTHAALTDIQQLLCLHLPAGEGTPLAYQSVHRLLNVLCVKSSAEVVHFLCNDCGQLIAEPCSSNSFGSCMHSQSIKFYEIPLDTQIQALFKGTH